MKRIKLFSCDTHLEHSPDVWAPYIPEKHREHLEHWKVSQGVGDLWLNTSGSLKHEQIAFGKNSPYEHNMPGAHGGPTEYLEWLDMDGVEAGVLFGSAPVLGNIHKIKLKDVDAYKEVIRGYNNWLSDFCAEEPKRLLGCALVPTTGVEDAVEELRRVRKLPGIATVDPGSFPGGGGRATPEDDVFWRECMDLGMPVSLHGGLGAPLWATGTGNWDVSDFAVWLVARLELMPSGCYAATQLILSGVFDRYPDFRISTAETGASFIPYWMDQMDNNYYRHRHWAGFDLDMPPSDYVKQGHFLWSVIVDYPAYKYRHDIGVHNITWASDFPHTACEWPRSRWLVDAMMQDVPQDEKYEMCWGNAARFYGLEA